LRIESKPDARVFVFSARHTFENYTRNHAVSSADFHY
jgi:hypothetical protein